MTDRHYYKWDEEKQVCTGYIRRGECKQCGACCRAHIVYRVAGEVAMQDRRNGGDCKINGIGIWSEVSTEDERTFFETREISEGKGCVQLEEKNICKEYKERRVVCAEWPFNPADLEHFPDCGYSFEENGEWTYEEIEEKVK